MGYRNLDHIVESIKSVEIKSSVKDLIINLYKRIYEVAFSDKATVQERSILIGKALAVLLYLAHKLEVTVQPISFVAESMGQSIDRVEALGMKVEEHSFTLYNIVQMGSLVVSAGELESEMNKTERVSNRLEVYKWQVVNIMDSLIVGFVCYAMKNGLDLEKGLTQAMLRTEEV